MFLNFILHTSYSLKVDTILSAVSAESAAADWHFTKSLGIVVIPSDPLAYIAYIPKVIFLAFFHCRTGIDPDNIAVIMGAKVKGLAEIVRTS